MTIRSRYEDAIFLVQNQRFDGGLLSILVAVAATSRKRYPKTESGMKDREAFTRFLKDEIGVLTKGAIGKSMLLKMNDADPKYYSDGFMPLEDVLYTFVRCSLVHEGQLVNKVNFTPSDPGALVCSMTDGCLSLSETYFDGLARVVQFAPENLNHFPDVKQLPNDVLAWFAFGERRESEDHIEYIRIRAERVQKLEKTIAEEQVES